MIPVLEVKDIACKTLGHWEPCRARLLLLLETRLIWLELEEKERDKNKLKQEILIALKKELGI